MIQQLEARPYTAWQLLKAYWQSEYRITAYFFLLFVLCISMILVGFEVLFTTWYNYFYNALQDYNKHAAFDLLVIFLLLAAVNIVLSVYRYYMQQFLALRWRRWLTEQFLNRWLDKKSYYYLENFDEHTDNPDQRIQEDIGSLVNASLSLLIGLTSAVVTILAFIYILWELSGIIPVSLGKLGHFQVHGYLVWVGVIYASIGSFFTFKIGRPLVDLNFEQQRREANFRFAAIDLRSHAEHVALYRGETQQKSVINKIFSGVLDNWYAIILRQKILLWFTAGYNQAAVFIPLLVALPNYFNKVFKLGGLIQALSAFQRIQDALSFVVNSYTAIAEWQAVMRRLLTFLNHINTVEQDAVIKNHLRFEKNSDNKIVVKQLTVNTPGGEKLLENINIEFNHGQHYLIQGPSGIGKSTFIRTIAGIWPYGSGAIGLPEKAQMMFLPQRSYMPLGTLQEALLFPNQVSSVSEQELKQLLHDCDLGKFAEQLQRVAPWSEQLSPGELQRIAFVRVLLQKPDWVFFDECTSALDLPHEKQLYQLVKSRLPHCSMVSVGHRLSLEEFHDRQMDLGCFK
jgi:putative ATP-binding cassette transporter